MGPWHLADSHRNCAAEGSTCLSLQGLAGHPGDTSALPARPCYLPASTSRSKRATALPSGRGGWHAGGPHPGPSAPSAPTRPQHRARSPSEEVSTAGWKTSRLLQRSGPKYFFNDPTWEQSRGQGQDRAGRDAAAFAPRRSPAAAHPGHHGAEAWARRGEPGLGHGL